MRPFSALALATAAIVFAAPAASARAATASTHASAVISESAGIDILNNVVLPTVITSVDVAGGGSTSVSHGALSNAALTIHGQTGEMLSMAVPASFQVVRSGGTEGLTVRTTTDRELRVSQEGVVLGGNELADGTMSIAVGGLVTLASTANIIAGPYEGTLVVLVQYN